MKINYSDDGGLRIFPKVRLIPKKRAKTHIFFPYELHMKYKETFEQKEDEALLMICNHLKEFKNPHVMTSHGNDSLVLCHLVIRACMLLDKPLPQFWLNDTLNTFPEEKPFWDYINKFLGIENHFKIFMPPKDEKGGYQTVWKIADQVGHLPYFRSMSKSKKKKKIGYKHTNTPECCDILKKESVKEYTKNLFKKHGIKYDLVFIGTRGQESQARSNNLLQRCRSYLMTTRNAYPKRVLLPLSFWTDEDIIKYYQTRMLPRNPTYEIHGLNRMGCASCPAYKGWEVDQLKDPTGWRFRQLKQNIKQLKKFTAAGTEIPGRYEEAINNLKKYIRSPESKHEITEERRQMVIELIQEHDPAFKIMDAYF